MALLHGITNQIELIVRPYQLTDNGQPTWMMAQLELRENGRVVLSSSFALTTDDLAELRPRLLDLAGRRISAFTVETTDGEVVFEGRQADRPDDLLVGFWWGEPHEIMKGYRFLVRAQDIPAFVHGLATEEIAAVSASRLS